MSILLLTATFIHVLEDKKTDGSGVISGNRMRGEEEESVTIKKSLCLCVQVSNFVIFHRVHFISHRCRLGLFCFFLLNFSLSLLSLMSNSFLSSWVSFFGIYSYICVMFALTAGSPSLGYLPQPAIPCHATKYICKFVNAQIHIFEQG